MLHYSQYSDGHVIIVDAVPIASLSCTSVSSSITIWVEILVIIGVIMTKLQKSYSTWLNIINPNHNIPKEHLAPERQYWYSQDMYLPLSIDEMCGLRKCSVFKNIMWPMTAHWMWWFNRQYSSFWANHVFPVNILFL